jgi:2-polyprenyl-3-methyl-5-hydroxy-6-metoxy-1,4-benzoquinol methylase
MKAGEQDKREPHHVNWTDESIKEYWDVYQTHPELFRNLIFIHGTTSNPTLDGIIKKACTLVPQGAKVLDVGFGNGYIIKGLALQGYECFGIDISEKNVALTQKEISEDRQLKEKQVTLKAGSILDLTDRFGADFFDLVIATDVFEHLNTQTLNNGLDQINNVMKKDGKALISTPYKEILERSYVLCPECYAIFHMVGHLQSFDEKRMTELLTQHHFVINECTADVTEKKRKVPLRKILNIIMRRKKEGAANRGYSKNLQTVAQKT